MASPKPSAEKLAHAAKIAAQCSNQAEAAYRLGISVSTLRRWLEEAPPASVSPAPLPSPSPLDSGTDNERKLTILRDENLELKRKLREAHRDGAGWDSIRESVLGLVTPPLRPGLDALKGGTPKKAGGRSVLLHLSDLHCGERVDLDEMGGSNKYSVDIFRARMSRLFHTVKELLTDHWKGDPPEKIVLIFGGDLIGGEIHAELAKTNDALSAPAVRICAETLAGGVDLLSDICPVDVYNVAGNHGRLTLKPESKGFASNSLDTLVGNIVEMLQRGRKDVRFFYPKSGDALIDVYHWTFCALHGDRTGSKGGQGFLGAMATIIRGMAKVHAYYASQGRRIHYVLQGHMHTTGYVPSLGISNGSVVGPSEYSRDLRAKPEEAKQNLIVVHEQKGIIDFKEIKVGDPSEGSIYGVVS